MGNSNTNYKGRTRIVFRLCSLGGIKMDKIRITKNAKMEDIKKVRKGIKEWQRREREVLEEALAEGIKNGYKVIYANKKNA